MNITELAIYKKMFGGGTSSNEPKSYTVSSFNELPRDAVEGSMAIVKSVVEATKWILNDELEPFEESGQYGAYFKVVNKDIDEQGKKIPPSTYMKYITVGPPVYALFYENVAYVYYYETDYGMTKGWVDEVYKTIAVADADENTMAWLEVNGTNTGEIVEISSTPELYIREAGGWVYQCKIV